MKSRAALEAMACLGGSAELGLLQVATGEPASVVNLALAPALEEGLLVAEPGAHQAVRFRHDRPTPRTSTSTSTSFGSECMTTAVAVPDSTAAAAYSDSGTG